MSSEVHAPLSGLAVAAPFDTLVGVAVLLPGVIVGGDLLVFPPVMLVVGTWLAIALVVLGSPEVRNDADTCAPARAASRPSRRIASLR